MTPLNPVIESLRGDIDSRPQTPTVTDLDLDKDERKEFLKCENELSDQLAEKESALVASEQQLKETGFSTTVCCTDFRCVVALKS